MGCLPSALAARLTEREFRELQNYAARRMLPQRRIELYLAQIALVVAKAFGGAKDATLADFMFDPIEDSAEPDVEAMKEAMGFNPRPKRAA